MLQARFINRITDYNLSNCIIPIPEKKDVSLEEAIEDSVQRIIEEKGDRKIYVIMVVGGIILLTITGIKEQHTPIFIRDTATNTYDMLITFGIPTVIGLN